MGFREPEYAYFPTEEFLHRVEKARALMDQEGLDALLLTAKENVIYFSGIRTIAWNSKHRPMGIVLPREKDKPIISVVPESLYEVSYYSSWIEELRPWGGWRRKDAAPDPITAFVNAFYELDVAKGRLGLELGYGQRLAMSQEDYSDLLARLEGASIVDAGPLIWDLRIIKSTREVEALRKVCEATTRGFEKGFSALKPGMTERQLGAIIMSELALQTEELPGFMMIRSGQMKYGMVNVEPFEKPMVPGELVVVDVGANYKHYWSDFMRMASIGNPSSEQKRFFNADLASQKAGVEQIKPGNKLHQIFDACYEVLLEHGMEEHVPGLERVGHGLGLDVHEPPSIARGSEVVIQPNMVLTVEPIFWDRPDHKIGNFALEDVVLVTEDGHEILSTFPKDLYVVEASAP